MESAESKHEMSSKVALKTDKTSKNASVPAIVDKLLDGKKPPNDMLADGGVELAAYLSNLIDTIPPAPSRCAHAMCCSAASGSHAIVAMLAKRPKETFNKAYNFNEPLRRACRSWIKSVNSVVESEKRRLCAIALVQAGADLDDPDKYLKSRHSARESLINSGLKEANTFIDELDSYAAPPRDKTKSGKSSSKKRKRVEEKGSEE